MPSAIAEYRDASLETDKRTIQIRVGFEMIYDCSQPTPMVLTLNVHPTRACDIVVPDLLKTEPFVPLSKYRDSFGNQCTRLVSPGGRIRIAGQGVVRDCGRPDDVVPWACQHAVEDLPDHAMLFLLGSRYCETDRLSETAWELFGQ